MLCCQDLKLHKNIHVTSKGGERGLTCNTKWEHFGSNFNKDWVLVTSPLSVPLVFNNGSLFYNLNLDITCCGHLSSIHSLKCTRTEIMRQPCPWCLYCPFPLHVLDITNHYIFLVTLRSKTDSKCTLTPFTLISLIWNNIYAEFTWVSMRSFPHPSLKIF